VSGPRERWPPGSAALVDIGAAEGIQVAVGVDPDSVGRQVGDGDSQTSLDLGGGRDARRMNVSRPGPTWVGNKTQPTLDPHRSTRSAALQGKIGKRVRVSPSCAAHPRSASAGEESLSVAPRSGSD
jgi:hypothetical protein